MDILFVQSVIYLQNAARGLPQMSKNNSKRIGIYSGSFDPVHKGHISFALSALNDARLDAVYFVVESLPRHKPGITHYAHRVAMLKLATRAHPNLYVLELPDKRFSVATTLPRLQSKFKGDQLCMLIGSDVLAHIALWPMIEDLLTHVGLVVGLRSATNIDQALTLATAMPKPLKELHLIESLEPSMASKHIRQSFRGGHTSYAVLPSVSKYIKKHWLYASVHE